MKIIFSPECIKYNSSGHPESPERVKNTYEYLKNMKSEQPFAPTNMYCKHIQFVEPESASDKDILLVHSQGLLNAVKTGSFFDMDTPALPNIFDYAKLSAGAAIKAAEFAIQGETAFSLMRPPGHHAGKNSVAGFCYFNNIAIAIKKINAPRSAILDIDCHHGNGTEEIFLGDKKVLYVSLHQSPLYPGTGLLSQDNCINYPLSAGTDEKEYLSTLEKAIIQIKEFAPETVGVSAGFDTYKGDPITNLNLEIGSYEKIGALIRGLDMPCFGILEGGYSTDMAQCVYSFLKGLE
ncbi:MAG: histone deacetylase [bacterium]|nr:histone deacetylase [bacterium]